MIETQAAEDALYDYRDKELDPHRMLLLAVLNRALSDSTISPDARTDPAGGALRGGKAKRIKEEATRWVQSNDLSPWSFCWICGELDIVPEYLLKAITRPGFAERINKLIKHNNRSGWSRFHKEGRKA